MNATLHSKYQDEYAASIKNPEAFWAEKADPC